MKQIIISDKDIKKLKLFNPCIHLESVLYTKDDIVYKFLEPNLADDREKTIEMLSEIENDTCITPIDSIIYDEYFSGYTMKYYKKYITLARKLIDPTIPYEIRKKLVQELWELLDYFKSINFAFYDLHENNFIINDEYDLKVLDLDSGIFKEITSETEYKDRLALSCKRASIITLNLLFGLRPLEFEYNFERNYNELYRMFNDNQNKILNSALTDPKEFNAGEYINEFNEHDTEEIKRKLKLTIY